MNVDGRQSKLLRTCECMCVTTEMAVVVDMRLEMQYKAIDPIHSLLRLYGVVSIDDLG